MSTLKISTAKLEAISPFVGALRKLEWQAKEASEEFAWKPAFLARAQELAFTREELDAIRLYAHKEGIIGEGYTPEEARFFQVWQVAKAIDAMILDSHGYKGLTF